MVVAPPPKPTTFKPIVQQNGSSLFHLAMEAQEIDGELAIAVAQLSSDDPEEAAQAEDLIQGILERANTNQQALLDKANQMAFVAKALQNRADYFKQEQKRFKEKSDQDQTDSERLMRYMVRALAALHPGKTEFRLAQFDLKSRQSETTEVISEDSIPADLCRHTITIDVPSGMGDTGPKLHQAISDWIADAYDLSPSLLGSLLPTLTSSIDKKLAKEHIKANTTSSESMELSVAYGAATHPVILKSSDVPGAAVIRKRSWSLT